MLPALAVAALAPYTGALAVFYLYLSMRTANFRRRERIGIGYGEHAALVRSARAHANFIEYVPFCLLILLMGGLLGVTALMLHALGLALLVGRVLHAYGILVAEPRSQNYLFRAGGMLLTLGSIGAGAALLLWQWTGISL